MVISIRTNAYGERDQGRAQWYVNEHAHDPWTCGCFAAAPALVATEGD